MRIFSKSLILPSLVVATVSACTLAGSGRGDTGSGTSEGSPSAEMNDSDEDEDCALGTLACPCTKAGTCEEGARCWSDICIPDDSGADNSTSAADTNATDTPDEDTNDSASEDTQTDHSDAEGPSEDGDDLICEPHSYGCLGNTLALCASDGSRWLTIRDCEEHEICNAETVNCDALDDRWCQDLDGDKFGDPEMCDYFPDEDDVPDDWVNDWTDCDDTDKSTHPGASEKEIRDECTRDADDDGFGDFDPSKPDIVPGTDCHDGDDSTYPGSASLEEARDGCFKDSDDDDWGDMDPPIGVEPGSDCDDNNQNTYPGNASNEADKDACYKDDDDDDWGDHDPPGAETPGSDCDDNDDNIGECLNR